MSILVTHTGKGIFARRRIREGEFVRHYCGQHLDNLKDYNDYTVTYKKGSKQLSIDATIDDGSYGHLLNNEHLAPNSKSKLIQHKGYFECLFFPLKGIKAGDEVTYNYDAHATSYPWRKDKVSNFQVRGYCHFFTLR